MKYLIDNDLHIHSYLSSCSRNPEQTKDNILKYAKTNGLDTICLTDHYWDSAVPGASKWYAPQNFEHISKSLPLPDDDKIRFLFGCECDIKQDLTLGMPKERFDDFDFVVIPTTHLHMKGFTVSEDGHEDSRQRADAWVRRLDALLSMDIPFHKVGIAHLACTLMDPRSTEDYLKTLSYIDDSDFERLFTKAARLGCGIELNSSDMHKAREYPNEVLRMFRIAKSVGCKFYLGSDSHNPEEFNGLKECFGFAIDELELTEDDKFRI